MTVLDVVMSTAPGGTFSESSIARCRPRRVSFDEPNLVANAGLLLVGTLAVRLQLERLVDATVHLCGRVGGARPGRKVLTLVHAIVAGASHIDHADVLRSGGTQRVLPFRVMAPSTLGTFLRSFSFGHVRQLEAVVGQALRRAWAMGGGPGRARVVIDVDSTVCEVAGKAKRGAAFGYTRVLGYHPILATRADTGEVIHARMRKGSANTSRGARRFIDELVARLRRAGAGGQIVMRFDSGFWSNETIATLRRLDVRYTMAVRTNNKFVAAAIATMDPGAWVDIDYTADGQAQVAECIYGGRRLIVRRTRLTGAAQARLWPDWRHFGFLTDLDGDAAVRRRLPPRPRHRRARHPRPQRGCRHGARTVGQLQRQQRLAAVRGAGPQPHPLDGHPRPARSRRAPHGGPHSARAAHHGSRSPGQPRRHRHLARPGGLAVGGMVHRPTPAASSLASSARLIIPTRPGAPPKDQR